MPTTKLTGDDDVLPVLLGEGIGVGLDLGEDEVVGGASLAVLLGLTAASDDLEALVEGVLGLLGDLGVGLALAAALGVADDDPADAHVGEHVGGGLAGEGAVALDPAVLGADGDVGAELLLDALDVHLGGADDDLGVGGEGRLVDHRDEVVDLGDGAVALPVTTDEELAGLRAGGGMEGAVFLVCRNSIPFHVQRHCICIVSFVHIPIRPINTSSRQISARNTFINRIN